MYKLKQPFLLFNLFYVLCALSACKKDNKEQYGYTFYELRIVSGDERNELSNSQTRQPLVMAVYSNNRQLGKDEAGRFSIRMSNLECMMGQADYDVIQQADGSVHAYWFTGEGEGKKTYSLSLYDETGERVSQVSTALNLTPNPEKWKTTCRSAEQVLLLAMGTGFLLLHKDGMGWTSPDAIYWRDELGIMPDVDLKQRANFVRYNQVTYTIFQTYTGDAMLYTSGQGGDWSYICSFPPHTRLLGVPAQNVLIVAEPGDGLREYVYQNNGFKKGKLLMSNENITGFEKNNTYAFVLDASGSLYRANGYNGEYLPVSQGLGFTKMIVKNNLLYAFSNSKVYESNDQGNTFTELADLPVMDGAYTQLDEVVLAGDRFYVFYKAAQALWGLSQMVSTKDWTGFTAPLKVRKYGEQRPNFAVADDGKVILHQENNFFIYKKP